MSCTQAAFGDSLSSYGLLANGSFCKQTYNSSGIYRSWTSSHSDSGILRVMLDTTRRTVIGLDSNSRLVELSAETGEKVATYATNNTAWFEDGDVTPFVIATVDYFVVVQLKYSISDTSGVSIGVDAHIRLYTRESSSVEVANGSFQLSLFGSLEYTIAYQGGWLYLLTASGSLRAFQLLG